MGTLARSTALVIHASVFGVSCAPVAERTTPQSATMPVPAARASPSAASSSAASPIKDAADGAIPSAEPAPAASSSAPVERRDAGAPDPYAVCAGHAWCVPHALKFGPDGRPIIPPNVEFQCRDDPCKPGEVCVEGEVLAGHRLRWEHATLPRPRMVRCYAAPPRCMPELSCACVTRGLPRCPAAYLERTCQRVEPSGGLNLTCVVGE